MIQKIKSKQEIRAEIEKERYRYLNEGGEINYIEPGISGRENNGNLNQAIPLTQGEKQTRTLLIDTVKTIDQRKQSKISHTSEKTKSQPKKRIIYDDFGEPIREVWE